MVCLWWPIPELHACLPSLRRNNRFSSLPVLPPGLQCLQADYNQLMSFPNPLPAALQTLAVCRNPLGSAGLPDLSDCRELHTLVVHKARLETLPPLPPSLQELSAEENALTSLPPLPSSMRVLFVRNNKLATLDLSPCRDLVRLTLGQNRLVSLDFSGCVKLKVVKAYSNKLTSITNMAHLPLRELDVSGNDKLTSLPALPPTLEVLHVSGNYRMAELPSPLPPKLRRVYCSGALVESLPPSLTAV